MIKPRVAVTIGDPNGIGPEIIARSFAQPDILNAGKFLILAPYAVVKPAFARVGIEVNPVHSLVSWCESTANIAVFAEEFPSGFMPEPGRLSEIAGRIAGKAVQIAADMAMKGSVDAVVTAPINKSALNQGGYNFPGHTEFLQHLTGSPEVVMTMLADDFRVAMLTNHCSLADVPGRISRELILVKLRILAKELHDRFAIPQPKLAVLALNPHAGENGLFGDEEIRLIRPAVEEARSMGLDVAGPFPADTVFTKPDRFDIYLAMYHDQAMIPIKVKAFGRGVNYTAGLPFIRTSPDHGTAFDIAGRWIADSGSMEEAIGLAIKIAKSSAKS
jgi:4-hydroxythreonine-4-phosphate dehydrogenase